MKRHGFTTMLRNLKRARPRLDRRAYTRRKAALETAARIEREEREQVKR